MKLAVVGGGSTYTPELIDGLLSNAFGIDEITLVDPDADRLEVVAGFARRMVGAAGKATRITATDDLDQGVDGAGAVLVQLRVGGQKTRLSDETFPHACGCLGQETTGAGGFAKALRTVPVMRDIASRVDPDTWIVDFTNPVGIVTRSLLDAGHKAVGLCNVAINFQRNFAGLLDVDPGRVGLRHVGLNHLSWETAVYLDGEDVLPSLLAARAEELAERFRITPEHLRLQGAVPSYYLRYYYAHDVVVAEQQTERPRAEVVSDVEQELLALYRDESVVTKPEALQNRGGRHYSLAAINLVASLLQDSRDVQVVNVRNRGTLPFLPDEAVIEAASTITAAGPEPLPIGPVDPLLRGLIAHTAAYEELAVDAALHGGRDRVVKALLAHPLVGQYALAEGLADRLLAENARFLPWA
ncbi:6-phospho-beta-glucosidase [Cryptosporangium arvum]|uniref:Family 4 glycosyl hydrolase, alpha-galactosidase/6-phospho-beta-glucosidase n=1 Tax=Cryptosporangium arvum DSM 44712 TaxID=927661 RepID=A0A010ZUZ6_9ACTN|nr:6-phospho-beta-glucosidase [Cryptosporangium arvum]EXG82519.1 family 4 glycosyl hydrolase, alpha-galactosidase/6-phospho-beta-glucosidase [Cryptosporangium arvum DSM 44712]